MLPVFDYVPTRRPACSHSAVAYGSEYPLALPVFCS